MSNSDVARKLREIQATYKKGNPIDQLLADLDQAVKWDSVCEFHFGPLSETISQMVQWGGYTSPHIDVFLEKTAQLFEADGITLESKRRHMCDPIYYFLQLHQVRDIIRSRVEGFFVENPNPQQEQNFWATYHSIDCDGAFTYDKYDKLIKAVNKHGLPNDLLRECFDSQGNQICHGDTVEAVNDIIHYPSGNKIPKGTRIKVKEFNPFTNQVEGDYNGTPWVFHGHQVIVQ